MGRAKANRRTVETLRHAEASRKNIPTAEFRSVMERAEQSPVQVAYERRNRDLDPQLVWRGKDEQDWSDLVVQVPPLFIQEKVHPKVLVDDLRRQRRNAAVGDRDAAQSRLAAIGPLPVIGATPEVARLAQALVDARAVPERAAQDAVHIAIAPVHRMPFLVTWNFRHIANAAARPRIEAVCRDVGIEPPLLCMPEQLFVAEDDDET